MPEPSPTARPLGDSYEKNGYRYKLVSRDGMVAIYGQFNKSIPLESATHSSYAAYEVIVIRTLPAATIMGKDTPERESCPGNEQWGTSGWTYKTLNEAKIKMQTLLDKKPSSGGVGKGDDLGVSKRN